MDASSPAATWLVFGATGAVGRCLLPALRTDGVAVIAASRRAPPADGEATCWVALDLDAAGAAPWPAAGTLASLGPLDRFAARLPSALPATTRCVVALSSTSVDSKRDSPDPQERALAARLRAAEDALVATCAARGVGLVLLRPTLIYGAGGDRNLSRLAATARRLGGLPLPAFARGLRQPVHAADLAQAVRAAAAIADPARAQVFALPGGETLSYREMAARVLACLPERPPLWRVPDALARPARAALRLVPGRRAAALHAMLRRLECDLVADAEPARWALGWAPRGFRPEPAMFAARG